MCVCVCMCCLISKAEFHRLVLSGGQNACAFYIWKPCLQFGQPLESEPESQGILKLLMGTEAGQRFLVGVRTQPGGQLDISELQNP